MARGHNDKIAVITGAANGIGQAFARRLAQDGAHVVVADIQPGGDTVKMVEKEGRQAMAVTCDVSSESSVKEMAAKVNDRFGRCDILINNAGIYPVQKFDTMTFADWRKIMSINLDSVFLTCANFVPGMRKRGWGRIVNIASSTFASVVPNLTHYIASKGGVVGFTRALATELANEGITVNAIAPGLTRTPGVISRGPSLTGKPTLDEELQFMANFQAIKRPEEPEDLVGAMSFLTSDDCSFITGQTLYVDGGKVRV